MWTVVGSYTRREWSIVWSGFLDWEMEVQDRRGMGRNLGATWAKVRRYQKSRERRRRVILVTSGSDRHHLWMHLAQGDHLAALGGCPDHTKASQAKAAASCRP